MERVVHEIHKRRLGRNLAVAGCLIGFMALVVWLSLVKIRNNTVIEGFDHVVRPALIEDAE